MFISVNGGILPQRQTTHSAGFDVFANEDMEICVGSTEILSLGIALNEMFFENMFEKDLDILGTEDEAKKELDTFLSTYYLELHPRSSLRAKGLIVMPGIIDMDYRDEIKMIIFNGNAVSKQENDLREEIAHKLSRKTTCNKYFRIKKGDKVGQLILKQHEGRYLPDEYTKDEKRTGGFGSTGA